MLSHPSVGRDPESCLRFWRSFVDFSISPLHTKFHSPLSHPSDLVSRAFPSDWLLSLSTRFTAYVPLTPSHSEEDLPPPSYRGCWHGVSRGFLLESCHDRALNERALQAALPFFTHAILLDRAFAHCPRFPTAAPRGSPGRVSVPVWLIIRKDQLSIMGLVSYYRTNYLILRRLIKQRFLAFFGIGPELFGRFPRVTHPFATLFKTLIQRWIENNVRLACVKHIASLPSEPGSNSSFSYDWALAVLVNRAYYLPTFALFSSLILYWKYENMTKRAWKRYFLEKALETAPIEDRMQSIIEQDIF
jgi:hypothetical protein